MDAPQLKAKPCFVVEMNLPAVSSSFERTYGACAEEASRFSSFVAQRSFFCPKDDDPAAPTTAAVLCFTDESDARNCAHRLLTTPVEGRQLCSVRLLRRVPSHLPRLQRHLSMLKEEDQAQRRWESSHLERPSSFPTEQPAPEPPAQQQQQQQPDMPVADGSRGSRRRERRMKQQQRQRRRRQQQQQPAPMQQYPHQQQQGRGPALPHSASHALPGAAIPPTDPRRPPAVQDSLDRAERPIHPDTAWLGASGGPATAIPSLPAAAGGGGTGAAYGGKSAEDNADHHGRKRKKRRKSSKLPPPAKAPPPDRHIRSVAVRQLDKALATGLPPSSASTLAASIEEAVFAQLGSDPKQYRLKLRGLVHNLTKNEDLRGRLASEELLPAALVSLSTTDIAPLQVVRHREQLQQRSLQLSVLTGLEAAAFSTQAALEARRAAMGWSQGPYPSSQEGMEAEPQCSPPAGWQAVEGAAGGRVELRRSGVTDWQEVQFDALVQPLPGAAPWPEGGAPGPAAGGGEGAHAAADPGIKGSVCETRREKGLSPGSNCTVDLGDMDTCGEGQQLAGGGGGNEQVGLPWGTPVQGGGGDQQHLSVHLASLAQYGSAFWEGTLSWGSHTALVQLVGHSPGLELPKETLPVTEFQPAAAALNYLRGLGCCPGRMEWFWLTGASPFEASQNGGSGGTAGLLRFAVGGEVIHGGRNDWTSELQPYGWEMHIMAPSHLACELAGVDLDQAKIARAARALLVLLVPCFWATLLPRGVREPLSARVYAAGPLALHSLPGVLDCRLKIRTAHLQQLHEDWSHIFGATHNVALHLAATPASGDETTFAHTCHWLQSDDVTLVAAAGGPTSHRELLLACAPVGDRIMLGAWDRHPGPSGLRQVYDLWDPVQWSVVPIHCQGSETAGVLPV